MCRYMEKMSYLRRLQLEEVDEVAFQRITLKDLVRCLVSSADLFIVFLCCE
jgi:hypothetical protein